MGEQKIILEFDRTPRRASQKVARSVCNCLPDAFGLVNQYLAIELVDEEPTEEMMSALDRFWEKVFAEATTFGRREFCKSEADELDDQKIIIEFDRTRRTSRTTGRKRSTDTLTSTPNEALIVTCLKNHVHGFQRVSYDEHIEPTAD